MSVFGPNQRQELLIGDTTLTNTVFSLFQRSAPEGTIGIISADGGDLGSNNKGNFFIGQKTNGNATKGLDYEFSEVINPKYVTAITATRYSAEVNKKVLVTGFVSVPKANATYQVRIRLYEDGGSLSPENFRHITGSFVTTDETVTNKQIIDGIVDNLNKSLTLEGTGLFTVVNVTDNSIEIKSNSLLAVNPAKDIADPVKFDVEASVKSNGINAETSLPAIYNILDVNTTALPHPGNGTGSQVKNLEWFCRGYAYEAYRQTGYPADFTQPDLYSTVNGTYDVINISHYRKNSVVGVEEQPRITTIAFSIDPAATDPHAQTNIFLGILRGTAIEGLVPDDLVKAVSP